MRALLVILSLSHAQEHFRECLGTKDAAWRHPFNYTESSDPERCSLFDASDRAESANHLCHRENSMPCLQLKPRTSNTVVGHLFACLRLLLHTPYTTYTLTLNNFILSYMGVSENRGP